MDLDLLPGARNAIRVCLNVQPTERVTVITDRDLAAGIAAAIEPLAVYDLPDDWWHAYRSRLEAVTPEDVQRVADELIRPDEALVLVVGDASKVADELRSVELGPVEVVSGA